MQNLAWDDLRLIKEIAVARGMAGAAAALKLDHSTVYRRLGGIETMLGMKLFERHRSGYGLTPAGQEIVEIAGRFEADINDFERRLRGRSITPRGEIRVATADSLLVHLLTPVFARFQQAHPEITLDVVIGNPALNLSKRDADVAIRATDQPPENLVGRRIGTIAWALYAASASLPVVPEECGWVLLGEEMAGLKVVRKTLATIDPSAVRFRANTVLGLACAVEAGIGMGHLPCFIGDNSRILTRLSPPEPEFAAGLWLLTHPDLRHSPRIRVFLDFLAAEMMRLKPLIEGASSTASTLETVEDQAPSLP